MFPSFNLSGMRHCFGRTRFVVLGLSVVCLTLIMSNMVALNFTVICMTKDIAIEEAITTAINESKVPSSNKNRTPKFPLNRNLLNGTNQTSDEFSGLPPISISGRRRIRRRRQAVDSSTTTISLYSSAEQGWLFSAYAVGQLIGTPPITPAISRIGFRYTMTIYGMISAVSTLLLPLCVHYIGFYAVLLMRVLQGTAVAAVWVATGAITAAWSPLSNYGMFLSLLSCNNQFGPVITMPLAGAICASPVWDWPMVYYFLGSTTLISFFVFFTFYADSPRTQKHVSPEELAIIEEGKMFLESARKQSSQKVPYKAILTDIVIWGLFVSFIASTTGIQLLMQFGPVYFNKVLGMQTANTGLATALPFLICAFLKILSGPLSDRIKCLSETAKVQLFASTSQYSMGACFLLLGFLPKFGVTNVLALQACFTGAAAAIAFNVVGVFKSTQFVACQYAHIIYAWVAILTSISWLIVPTVVSWLTPNNSLNEWSIVYSIAAAIVAGGTTLFNCTAQVKPRPWTKVKKNNSQSQKETTTAEIAA